MTSSNPSAHDAGQTPSPPLHPHEVFDLVGGLPAFERLVESFYARVEHDDVLRPIYPEDLEPGKRHLALFLAQYWGGGDLYSRDRGHPRLRMRHARFPITPEVASRWAQHMSAAIEEQDFDPAARDLMLRYVAEATPTLVNDFGQLPPHAGGSTLPQA